MEKMIRTRSKTKSLTTSEITNILEKESKRDTASNSKSSQKKARKHRNTKLKNNGSNGDNQKNEKQIRSIVESDRKVKENSTPKNKKNLIKKQLKDVSFSKKVDKTICPNISAEDVYDIDTYTNEDLKAEGYFRKKRGKALPGKRVRKCSNIVNEKQTQKIECSNKDMKSSIKRSWTTQNNRESKTKQKIPQISLSAPNSSLSNKNIKTTPIWNTNKAKTAQEEQVHPTHFEDNNESQPCFVDPPNNLPNLPSKCQNDSAFIAENILLEISQNIANTALTRVNQIKEYNKSQETPLLLNKNPILTHRQKLASTPRLQDESYETEMGLEDLQTKNQTPIPSLEQDINNCFGFEDSLSPSKEESVLKADNKFGSHNEEADWLQTISPVRRASILPQTGKLGGNFPGLNNLCSPNFEANNANTRFKSDTNSKRSKDAQEVVSNYLTEVSSKPSRFAFTTVNRKEASQSVSSSVHSSTFDFQPLRNNGKVSLLENKKNEISQKANQSKVYKSFNSDNIDSSKKSKILKSDIENLAGIANKPELNKEMHCNQKMIKDCNIKCQINLSDKSESFNMESSKKRKNENPITRASKISKQTLIYEIVGGNKNIKGTSRTGNDFSTTVISHPSNEVKNSENNQNDCHDNIASSAKRVYSKKNNCSRISNHGHKNTKEKEMEQWETLQSSHFEEIGDVELSFL